MAVENWDEIRTAWHVVRAGTVSGAADLLGVHHATVIRHVDALEERLGVKLFQRHSRGYTPTEAGQALAQIAGATEEQFTQLAMRLQGDRSGISGDLVISTLPQLATILHPAVADLARAHPALNILVRTEERLARLEYGEAHVAVRAGTRPTEPDNIVQELLVGHFTLLASPAYAKEHGLPQTPEDLSNHRLVTEILDGNRAPVARWLGALPGQPHIVLQTNETDLRLAAIKAGLGMGFLNDGAAHADLIEIMPPLPEWGFTVWMVTHVDLHRTPKVQAATSAIRKTLRR